MRSLEKAFKVMKKHGKSLWTVNPDTQEIVNKEHTMVIKVAVELESDVSVLKHDPSLIQGTAKTLSIYEKHPPEAVVTIAGSLLKAAMEAVEKTDNVILEFSADMPLRLRVKDHSGSEEQYKNAPETVIYIAPKIFS